MPKYIFQDSENLTFETIPEGDYPFEIVDADEAVQSQGKTKGSDVINLKVRIFKDDTFAEKLAQWKEQLIFHSSCFWKVDTFMKACGLARGSVKGEEIEVTDKNILGRRGWCGVGLKPSTSDPTREFNYVAIWYTDKPPIPPHLIDATDLPPSAEDDVTW